jgi:LysM repeat protein
MKKYTFLLLITIILAPLASANDLKDFFPKMQADFSENIDKYCIKGNDTLAKIALRNKISVSFILYLNKDITEVDKLYAGQVIRIPGEKIISLIESQSQYYLPLIRKLGANEYKKRKVAMDELTQKDWRVIPILLKTLKHQDVEIRENARETLHKINQNIHKLSHLQLK